MPIKLTQKRLLGGCQDLELSSDKLTIRTNARSRRKEVSFPLEDIDPDPSLIWEFSLTYLLATIFLSASAVAFAIMIIWFVTNPKDDEPIANFIWPLCFCCALAVVAFREFRYRTIDVAQFVTRSGGYFSLWRTLPTKAASEFFLFELRNRIASARFKMLGMHTETLANEIRGLDKLCKDGLLTEEEFKRGKARILGPNQGESPQQHGPTDPGLN